MTGWRADLTPWRWGSVTALLIVLSNSMEKESKGEFRDCLLSSSLMHRTHKDGGASCSPLLIPCNKQPTPGRNNQEPSASWSQWAGEEKGCVHQALCEQR